MVGGTKGRRSAPSRRRLALAVLATTLASAAVLATTPAGLATSPEAGKPANVRVVDLRVNGRSGDPVLDVGDRSPVLAWRMTATPASASHRCRRSGQQTSSQIAGTWGYYVMTRQLAKMAELTGHATDAAEYAQLAAQIKAAFNAQFYNPTLKLYATNGGAGGATGATQVAQALALDAGLAPEADREAVLDHLVENMYGFQSADGRPHFSGGTIGLSPTIRALIAGGRDDVVWDALQSDTQPSYGFFMESTNTNPGGFTTVGENWGRGSSRNHMILAQIEEWFHESLAGIREAGGSTQYRELVIKPRLVGDLTSVSGSYRSPQGLIRSEWLKDSDRFDMTVEVPANTMAEVWVPRVYKNRVSTPRRAKLLRTDEGYDVYRVGSGVHTFASAGPVVPQ